MTGIAAASFFSNTCRFGGCGLHFPTLADLIEHIEDNHIDTDPRVLEKQELQQPTYVALSYINSHSLQTPTSLPSSPFVQKSKIHDGCCPPRAGVPKEEDSAEALADLVQLSVSRECVHSATPQQRKPYSSRDPAHHPLLFIPQQHSHGQRVRRGGGGLRGVGQRRVLDHGERHQLRSHPQLHVHERRGGEAFCLPGSRM
ncbi:juxtaposed with another zinc finger protein 1 isoform X2 [Ursus maritimus]|uniref:Juxtaposed with another zinc finger protein 1 isoform X2 n=1 Tax=Ursus maritimus TaxID=29073 RepID=A0A8M1GWH2_URSMA|nr:juxtaposed with another zinc finger protein 1 isoform X2 [Ursus maritimus]